MLTASPTRLTIALDSNVATVSITVNAVNDAPVVVNDLSTQDVQYSDPIAPVNITANDVDSSGSSLVATTSFTKNGGSSQTGLPAGLILNSLTNNGVSIPGTAVWNITGNVQAAPGTYAITVTVTDGIGGIELHEFQHCCDPGRRPRHLHRRSVRFDFFCHEQFSDCNAGSHDTGHNSN